MSAVPPGSDKDPQPTGWTAFKTILGKFGGAAGQKRDKDAYEAAYAGMAAKLKALPAVAATPPPLKPLRQEVDAAEAKAPM